MLTGLLLLVALAGHLYAAHAIGGSAMAYQHHVLGFVVLLVVTGPVIAGIGWRYWRTRRRALWLVIAAVQAVAGVLIAANPFAVV